MPKSTHVRCAVAPGVVSFTLLAWPAALDAQQTFRLGSELQVNTFTTGLQSTPAVAADPAGDFVVAWSSADQDGSAVGVFARRFDFRGVPLAVEFQVNSFTTDRQYTSAVAMDAAGNFIVAWDSQAQDGDRDGIFARRFDSAGVPQATELQVNTNTASYQRSPAVAAAADGDFVVAWLSYDVDSDYDIFGQRFDSAGAPQGAEFRVNTFTTGQQVEPAVAADAEGDLVVTWSSDGQDGSNFGVFARRFDSTGATQAVEFQVNTYSTSFQLHSSVSADADGDFVVAWDSESQDGSDRGIFARRFDSAGVPQAVELQVNTHTTSSQITPAVAADADGKFVIAWRSEYQDGSSGGVFAQRFATLAVLDIDGNGATGALTDGLLVLRYLFGFDGTTLVSGAVDIGGCTRCSAGDIEAYLQTLI